MKIDVVASLPHYLDHMLPIFEALPERLKGRVHPLSDRAHAPMFNHIALVAGWPDLTQLERRCRMIYVEHGAGQGYCLAPETKVLRGDLRWVPIKDLVVGDDLVAFEEERTDRNWRKWQPATVTATRPLELPCYRLVMSDGTEVVASADHRWLRREKETFGWLTTKELQDRATFPSHSSKLIKAMNVWEEDASWGGGYLAAALDGEGHFTQTKRGTRQNRMMLGFSQKPNAMLSLVRDLLDQRGYRVTLAGDADSGVSHLSVLGGAPEVLRLLGSIRPRRLLSNLKPMSNGQFRGTPVEVLEKHFLGVRPVIGLATSTGTLIAEGFASHNSGDPKSAWLPGYSASGGRNHRGVIGYIAPSQTVADRWHPKPAVAVGCPKMDRWYGEPRLTYPAVCIAWHWDAARVSPEARSAFAHYQASLPQIVDTLHHQNVAVYAHAHPRWGNTLDREFWKAGFDAVLSSDREVFQQCSVLAMDNSSLMYEFASLGRPVVALNAPWYRREVDHGLRFWQHVPGWQADDASEAIDLLLAAIVDPTFGQEFAVPAVAHAYEFVDGRASERAAQWITQLVDAM